MKTKILNPFKFLLGILMLFQGAASFAAPWSVDPHDYRYDMSLYMSFSLSGTQLNYNDYTFGAFINNECRGVGEILNETPMTSPVIYMRVYGNEISGDAITFQAYNNATGDVVSTLSGIMFESEARVGMPSEPYQFNFIIPVSQVNLSPASSQIKIGETVTLTASVSPENASDKSIIWSSSDALTASVENGIVTGKAIGNCVITATATNGVSASSTITVLPVECESVTLNKTSYQGRKGETLQLNATVLPANTTDKTLTWTSSNVNIATVNNLGLVELKGIGEAVITVACGDKKATCSVTVSAPLPESVSISPASVTLAPNESTTFTVSFTPQDAETSSLTWTSNNANVATVNSAGKVTAIAQGNAVIMVTTAEGKTATCSVSVIIPVIEVTEVKVTPATGNVNVGSTIQLSATVSPENATDKTLTWKSSDTSIATVDNKGLVTGVKAGKATISATAVNGKQGTAEITVNNVECSSVTLNYTEFTGQPGNTLQFTATIAPENTTIKTVTWESGDQNIATVNSNGLVTLKNLGTTQITAQCGTVKATCAVTVVAPSVEVVVVTPLTAILAPGDELQLSVSYQPENAVTSSLTWKSADPKVATVSESGLVKAVAEGETTITATTAEGKTAGCTVTVRNNVIEVTALTIAPESTQIYVGSTATFTATISPENATDKTISWSSSDTSVATVAGGIVTAVAPGTAVITATANNGVKASANVTVLAVECEGLSLNYTEFSGKPGETLQLTATITPENTTNKNVSWSSSDTNVATVSSTGLVTLIDEGEATVVATCGSQTAICEVTVYPIQEYVEVEEVVLDPSELIIMVGEKYALTATILPDNATDTSLIWTSSEETVASVENGVITAIKAGTAIITANAVNGVSGECNVTCQEEAGVESIFEGSPYVSIYSFNGVLLKKNVEVSAIKDLQKGVYLLKGKNKTVKLIL